MALFAFVTHFHVTIPDENACQTSIEKEKPNPGDFDKRLVLSGHTI
jgi:hypothetical protein